MRQDFSASYVFIALAFAMGIGFVMWGSLANLGDFEQRTNAKYSENITLDHRAMKTIVMVNGEERADCFLQRGTASIVCRPPLTPEAKTAKNHKNKDGTQRKKHTAAR